MLTKPPLLLIGAGGHASSCIDVIEQNGGYDIVGIVGIQSEVNKSLMGYKVIASDADIPQLSKEYSNVLICIGQISEPHTRIKIYNRLLTFGFKFPKIISPRAYVSPRAFVGSGSVVMHGAFINSGSRIGQNCIINSTALIEHGAEVSDHCHISTAAVLNGNVKIGYGSFVGSGALIREGVKIPEMSVISMGAHVRSNEFKENNY